jgi:predicted GIY-YIG superfamily endonuclease
MRSFYLYIVKCFDGSYYVGYTDNLNKRLSQHNAGEADCYTAHRKPVELVATQIFKTRIEAFRAE